MALTPLKAPFNKNQWDSIKNYIANLLSFKQDKFDKTNIASGVASATLNTMGGVVTFSDAVAAAPNTTTYTINNSLVQNDSIVNVIAYCTADDSFATIVGINVSVGVITIHANDAVGNPSSGLVVAFQILA